MEYYLIKYKPPRSTFVDDATEEESLIIEKHFAYLQKLLAEEILYMAGRADDGHLGIAVIRAESEEKARSIMENDPAVTNGVFSAELHLFRLALKSG